MSTNIGVELDETVESYSTEELTRLLDGLSLSISMYLPKEEVVAVDGIQVSLT